MLERYGPEQHPLPRNPNGWFAVGLSHELLVGGVRAASCLGQDLVVFRTMAGAVGVLDAYCPHLGTHLGLGGCVEGEALRCPFHRWAFDVGGRCVDVPSAKRVPPQATVRHWPVVERNGAILAWFHANGEAPSWQMPELDQATWSPTSWLEMDYTMHIQEFAENGIDLAHFPVVHGSARAGTDLLDAKSLPFHFILKTAYPGDGIGLPGQYVNVTTEWRYYGLGIFLGVSTADDFGAQIRQLFHFTPVPGDRIILRIGFNANRSTIPEDMIEQVQEKNRELTTRNFEEDRIIWQYKRYLTRPMLSEVDGPFGALRRWTRQFYPSPRAEQPVAADMEQLPEQEQEQRPDPEGVPALVTVEDASAPVAAAVPASVRAVHDTFFERLPAQFNAKAAAGREFVIQYDLSGDLGGSYFVEVRNGACMPSVGVHAAPTVRVSVDAEDWLKIDSGALNRTKAYLTGRLKVKGDMALAVKLGEIFRN